MEGGRMKVVITGNNGFVGKATQKYFIERGIEAIGFDITNGQDITDWSVVHKFMNDHKPDVVLHEAAIAQFSVADANPKLAYQVNVKGTDIVSSACAWLKIPLVHISTGSTYMPIEGAMPIKEDYPVRGNSVYGCSKATAEAYAKEAGRYIILRYGHLYGKEKIGHGLIGGYLKKIGEGKKPILMGGSQTNDFMYINDVCGITYEAVTAIVDPKRKKAWNQAFNAGSGVELTAKEAGDILCDVVGWKGGVEITAPREVDANRFVYDMSKAKKLLGFKPKYSFREGLEDMLNNNK